MSPQTREILATGLHPTKAAIDSGASMIAAPDTMPDPDPTMAPDRAPARRRRLAAQGFGDSPELTGLAIGS